MIRVGPYNISPPSGTLNNGDQLGPIPTNGAAALTVIIRGTSGHTLSAQPVLNTSVDGVNPSAAGAGFASAGAPGAAKDNDPGGIVVGWAATNAAPTPSLYTYLTFLITGGLALTGCTVFAYVTFFDEHECKNLTPAGAGL